MVQHLVVVPLQSVSAWHSWSPRLAASHTCFAPGTSDLSTHAWPIDVSHVVSLVQNCGQAVAAWQTLPPDP